MRLALAMLAAGLGVAPGVVQAGDPSPPDGPWPAVERTARPWAYWWWMGSAVNQKDLTRNLEICRRAGYGGLHIIPIYGAKGYESQYIEYLSPKWMDMLAHAAAEARRLEMGVDMTTGTGWCFGGPTVSERDGCANVQREVIELGEGERPPDVVPDSVQALAAYGAGGRVEEITDRIQPDGRVNWRAPGRGWKVWAISQKSAGRRVKRAAPGGEGLMVNPFSAPAMERYLERFERAFADYRGAPLRAMYHDSYEYSGNWSPELLDEFEARRGYRLQHHLPALFGEGDPEKVARVRTDFAETLSDLHLAYIRTWADWCRRHGWLTRNQAHGSPSNLLDTYAAADIPETEMFHTDRDTFVSKFASSAAHVEGKRLVASETGTWLNEHFHVTLAQLKELVDQLFLSGVNHVIYHGTCYSPAEAPWPGWVFYASTQMNWRNSIWLHAPALNAYIARCQSVLQHGTPDTDVLLYWPLHDLWRRRKEMMIPFSVHRPWLEDTPFRAVCQRLWDEGWQFDYISDRQLERSRAEDGRIVTPGGMRCRVVIAPRSEVMPVGTLRALLRLARGGAAVVLAGGPPRDVPGWARLAERRRELQGLLAELRFAEGPGARRAAAGEGVVLAAEDVAAALDQLDVPREPLADLPGLRFIRRADRDGWWVFWANQSGQSVAMWRRVARPGRAALWLDPMTGRWGRAASRRRGGQLEVFVCLAPGESRILRILRDGRQADNAPAWRDLVPAGEGRVLEGPWRLEFVQGGPALPQPRRLERLASWTESPDAAAQRFAGAGRYTIRFNAPAGRGPWILELGRVCESARLWLNGRDLGVVFAPPWRVVVDELAPEQNELVVEVVNTSANRVRDLDRRGVVWRIFHDINFVNINYRPFDASAWPLRPSGLLGPVRLRPARVMESS